MVTSSYINSFFEPRKYEKHGVAIATARAGNVIGGGDWAKDRIIPDIMKSIEKNEKMFIRSPYSIRPWQHVLEPLSGYLMLAEKLFLEGVRWTGAWNFGPSSDATQNVESLVKAMEKYYEQDLLIELDLNNKLHETTILKLDCAKAIEVLGWKNTFNFEQTVALTAEWYKNYYNKDNYKMCVEQIQQIQQKLVR